MKRIATLAIISITLIITANAQSKIQAEIIEALGLPASEYLGETLNAPSIKKEITVEYDKNGELLHIGVNIFGKRMKQQYATPICNFIERLLLELCIKEKETQAASHLNAKKIEILYNGIPYGKSGFRNINSMLGQMTDITTFTSSHNGKMYHAHMEYGANSIDFKFPASRELIQGTDKKEADEAIAHLLRGNLEPRKYTKSYEAQKKSGALYISYSKHFMLDSINNQIFLEKKNGSYTPVYNKKYTMESIKNTFTGACPTNLKLNVSHKVFDKNLKYTIPLEKIFSAFEKDYECFTAVSETGKGQIEVMTIFLNNDCNYIHMLITKISKENFWKQSITAEAILHSNIPQHNIKDLLKK